MGIDTTLLPTHSQNGKAPILHISLDRDIQNSKPGVHVRLGRAGVVGITKAILIGDKEGQQQWFNAQFDLYADLGATQAGVHMSRFSDALDEVMEDMVYEYARVRLQEEGFAEDVIEKMLDITPLATHNQRGKATLMIGTNHGLDARDLIDLAEGAMSSENYGLLKRPDELYIVNKAHANPRFVEDVAREILRAVVEKYTELPDDTFVWVRQRNEETIHKYDVEAEGWGTLGELRAEILNNVNVERHTTREEWLNNS